MNGKSRAERNEHGREVWLHGLPPLRWDPCQLRSLLNMTSFWMEVTHDVIRNRTSHISCSFISSPHEAIVKQIGNGQLVLCLIFTVKWPWAAARISQITWERNPQNHQWIMQCLEMPTQPQHTNEFLIHQHDYWNIRTVQLFNEMFVYREFMS